ncbi:MAG: ATP-binding protein [Phycisphaerae bacterium]|nr:ATP-binding protein [Phycisphaerae bacterium]MCZ2400644.1 ATP-binding protein [Phycisphaerae bacterium]NUQ49838.1 ATP-binding protein [Phycisphaerae bacterium]
MDPLEIGHVIGVDGDTVDVQISVEDLKLEYHGKTYRIGRLGTYVTLPMDRRTLIGYITKVGFAGDLEPGPYPGPPRRITVTSQLLGTVEGDRFSRGVNEYPTLGDPVRLGVDEDFELIFGCFDELAGNDGGGYRKAFSMGRFAIDTDFEVKVLGKEFFAKHVAVMGNSGSGKSCTTAKIVHEATSLKHAQVVLFDMHGEYLKAFSDEFGNPLPNVTYLSDRNLVLPYWLLAYEEFEQLFIDRHNPLNVNAQKLFLREALEKLKLAGAEELGLRWEMTVDTPVYYDLQQLLTYAINMNNARYVLNTQNYAFARLPYRQLPPHEQEQLLLTKRMQFNPASAEGEVPHATYFGKLLGLINNIEGKLNDRRYDFLLRPFEQAKRNSELAGRMREEATPGQLSRTVTHVLRQILGQLDERRNLTIVDLSGLPFDVVDTTVAVLTRALFDFNFWSPPDVRHPVLLVFEEAHNYLPRKPIEGRKTFARDAVEKVAKEGRKYGVSAMIVSQRPSEISETVLSQCNSMVLMRMNNPDDQEYAARVVSDQFRSLISLLPSLKPGEGFIIGDGVLMPMRTLIDMPPREPQSANMDFFRLWATGGKGVDADVIVERWWRQERSGHQAAKGKPEDSPAVPEASPAPAGDAPAGSGFVPLERLSYGCPKPQQPQEQQPQTSNDDMRADPQPEEPVADAPDADADAPSADAETAQAEEELILPAQHDARPSGRSLAQRKLAELAARLSGRSAGKPGA